MLLDQVSEKNQKKNTLHLTFKSIVPRRNFSKMSTSIQQTPSMSNIKDDDEFEDFQIQDWDESQENGIDAELWQDDWDEEIDDSEFTMQLRAELEKEQKARQDTNNAANNVEMQD